MMSSSLSGPACFSAYQVGQNCAAYRPKVNTKNKSGQRNERCAFAAAFQSTGSRNTSASKIGSVKFLSNCSTAS